MYWGKRFIQSHEVKQKFPLFSFSNTIEAYILSKQTFARVYYITHINMKFIYKKKNVEAGGTRRYGKGFEF